MSLPKALKDLAVDEVVSIEDIEIDQEENLALIASRGTGKTTLHKHLLARRVDGPWVAWDPKGTFPDPVSYEPENFMNTDEADAFFAVCWDARPMRAVIEEGEQVLSPAGADPPQHTARFAFLGREDGCSYDLDIRRPQVIMKALLDECDWLIIGKLRGRARDYMADYVEAPLGGVVELFLDEAPKDPREGGGWFLVRDPDGRLLLLQPLDIDPDDPEPAWGQVETTEADLDEPEE